MGKDIKESLLYLQIWIFSLLNTVMKIESNDQCADSRKEKEQNSAAQQLWAS